MTPEHQGGLQIEESDEDFVQSCYRRLLGREPDEGGRITHLAALRQGLSRFDVILNIVRSAEFYTALTKSTLGDFELPNLRELRPANFYAAPLLASAATAICFQSEGPADYDWLERMIQEHGYYEKPGVWSLAIDSDKRVIAEIIGHFPVGCCLELGCATGAVLKLLREQGIESEGVEISHMALAMAYPEIRKSIHFGDLLNLQLESKYDMIIGMDVFEHLNPNKISEYVDRCFQLLGKGGFLFTNIPAFGTDPTFGEVFPIYLQAWRDEASKDSLFSAIHVDDAGWPLNGHLIWTTATRWQHVFEQAGFVRQTRIEEALHQVYDPFFLVSAPARKSFFVFSKDATSSNTDQIAASIRQKGSSCL